MKKVGSGWVARFKMGLRAFSAFDAKQTVVIGIIICEERIERMMLTFCCDESTTRKRVRLRLLGGMDETDES
jgi:hypothetical protein